MPEVELVINSEQLATLLRKLDELDLKKMLPEVLASVGKSVASKAGVYPPTTIANWPSNPTGRWYQRGFGTKYASGASYETSENLGDQWKWITGPDYVIVKNTARYAWYVHGPGAPRYHRERGWKQLLPTAQDELPAIIEKLRQNIVDTWEGA